MPVTKSKDVRQGMTRDLLLKSLNDTEATLTTPPVMDHKIDGRAILRELQTMGARSTDHAFSNLI
jgi:hypothetical protein